LGTKFGEVRLRRLLSLKEKEMEGEVKKNMNGRLQTPN